MKFRENQTLEQILEFAIVAFWKDMTNGTHPELIHIEYNLAPGGTLANLSIWSSITRGHWLLVCEYWMSDSDSHSKGVRFENGYHSEGLAHVLEFVMQDQDMFALPTNLGRAGLLQVRRPTEAEIVPAAASVGAIFDHFTTAQVQPALT